MDMRLCARQGVRPLPLKNKKAVDEGEKACLSSEVRGGFQPDRPNPATAETLGGAFDSAKNHKRQRRKRQSATAKREKSQTPKFV